MKMEAFITTPVAGTVTRVALAGTAQPACRSRSVRAAPRVRSE
jgi:biotin carboxyl carrier protein